MAEFHDKAFGCATCLEELREFDLNDMKSKLLELAVEPVADRIENDRKTNVDSVAGEVDGVRFANGDSFFGWVEGLDAQKREVVEGIGKVHDEAIFERGETGIEVVEARVDKVERGDRNAPCLAQRPVAGDCSAGTMSHP